LRILGIVTETHDSGLAILEEGVPELVLEEERFNREKHTLDFPHR
jgi:carbamoyltransferase